MAPGFQFAPSDVDFVRFEPKSDLHGLGYKGLDVERHLKSTKNLEKESSLKTSAQQKRGIRGQVRILMVFIIFVFGIREY